MNRLFEIALTTVNAKDSLLLIDEIDSGLHHAIQADVWRMIFELARRLNIQVFAPLWAFVGLNIGQILKIGPISTYRSWSASHFDIPKTIYALFSTVDSCIFLHIEKPTPLLPRRAVFATAHSWDYVEAFQAAASQNKENDKTLNGKTRKRPTPP